MSETTAYDYIIVGAGSAGCVLANRLSADPANRVLLLEAGPEDSSPLIHTPAMMAHLPDSQVDWRYRTVPQLHANMRKYPWPRGRVLGGSSSINYMIYIRGVAQDYDHWRQLGNPGWSWEDVLPYFKRAENNERVENDFHGRGGPLNVADHKFRHPLSQMFLESAQAAGIPYNDDFNSAEQEGCGWYQVTQLNGQRCSTAVGYLHPVRASRPNLEVVTEAQALGITVTGGRATGVEYLHQGRRTVTATARREVVLASGAIGSPQQLLLSGIGPAEELKALGITPVHDLPGVGRNLQDHLGCFVRTEISQPVSLYGMPPEALEAVQKEFVEKREGFLTSNVAEAGCFVRTDGAQEVPALQYFFLPYFIQENFHESIQPDRHGLTLVFYLNRPASRGRITLASANPLDQPLIDPQYFSDPADKPFYAAGIRVARRIFSSGPFAALCTTERAPGPEYQSDDDLIRYAVERETTTIYHPVGTCKMGTDAQAVVDPELRVRGIAGLRVVDGSIMPTLIGGNTNAPIIMIAEKAADMILEAARRDPAAEAA